MTSLQRLLTAALAALLLLLPAAAHASSSMETGIADDAALLNEPSDARAAAAVADWAALGIDDVRIFVQWQAIAPGIGDVKAPAGFDSANPDSPGYNWSRVDRAVNLVSAAGHAPDARGHRPGPAVGVAGPRAATASATSRAPTSSGSSRAPRRCATASAVDRWIIWNEPNLPLWLQPQNTCTGKRCTPYAPHLYRKLVRAAYPAIKTVDPTSTVLFGALAPRGENADQAERPHACRWPSSARWAASRRRSSAIAAGRARASSRSPATASPTTRTPPRARPTSRSRDPRRGRRSPTCRAWSARSTARSAPAASRSRRRQVRPLLHRVGLPDAPARPDPAACRWPSSRADLQQGTYIAYKDPRVKLLTQYEWRDERARPRHGQRRRTPAGSRACAPPSDKAKPSLATFANPFVIDQRPGSRTARLWGQVRPGNAHSVTVQRRKAGLEALDHGEDAVDQRRRLLEANADGQRDDRLPLPAGSRPTPTTRRSARSRPATSSARRSASARR